MTLLWLAITLGCQPGPANSVVTVEGDLYTLILRPVTPPGEDTLIDQADMVQIVIEQRDGDLSTHVLTGSGDNVRAGTRDAPALDHATITLIGSQGADVIFWGQTPPVSLKTGELDIHIFVATSDALSPLPALPEPLAFAPIAATGDGRFFVFGGADGGVREVHSSGAIHMIDLGSPSNPIEFTTLRVEMPETDDGYPGRMGHTATALPREADRPGPVLVTGGSPYYLDGIGGLHGNNYASADAFLFHPDDSLVQSTAAMDHARLDHSATLNPNGDVVVYGGWGRSSGGEFAGIEFVETFDSNTQQWTTSSQTLSTGIAFHAGARLGDQGILVCGGLTASFEFTDQCELIAGNGVIESAPSLPATLSHSAMTSLADGRVLLTGGLDTSGASFGGTSPTTLLASNQAWVSDGGDWTEVGRMNLHRAMHTAVALSDGRVLIAGGVLEINSDAERVGSVDNGLIYDHAQANSCAEIWDPETGEFSPLSDCSQQHAAGELPERTLLARAATDPVHGTVIAGGIGIDEGRAVDGVIVFRPPLDL